MLCSENPCWTYLSPQCQGANFRSHIILSLFTHHYACFSLAGSSCVCDAKCHTVSFLGAHTAVRDTACMNLAQSLAFLSDVLLDYASLTPAAPFYFHHSKFHNMSFQALQEMKHAGATLRYPSKALTSDKKLMTFPVTKRLSHSGILKSSLESKR